MKYVLFEVSEKATSTPPKSPARGLLKKFFHYILTYAITSLAMLIFFAGCVNTGYNYEEEIRKVVIIGYLYANEPVSDISIKTLRVYGISSDSIQQEQYPVEDADVLLKYDGQEKLLGHTTGGLYQALDVIVGAGKTYEIEVSVRDTVNNCDIIATARTTVPEKTQTPAFTDTVLYAKQHESFHDFDWLNAPALWFTIDNPGHSYYIAKVVPVDVNAELIVTSWVPQSQSSNPFNGENSRVSVGQNIFYFGKNWVKIYKLNDEFADLWSCYPFSSSMNEPPSTFISNVNNGYGLFTALHASDSVTFEVIKIPDTTSAGI